MKTVCSSAPTHNPSVDARPSGLGSDGSPCHARDDAKREYAYGLARALPATKVSAVTQAPLGAAPAVVYTVYSVVH